MKYQITSKFGEMESGLRSRPHTGIDFAMPKDTNIHSVSSGIVHLHNYGSVNSGKTILIEDGNGHTFIYGHLNQFRVHEGQHIHSGDTIGLSGSTGNSTGFHLHFGVRDGSQYVDPSPYVSKIEHMNGNVANHIQIVADHNEHATNFMSAIHSQINIYSDLLQHVKVNFINFVTSIDYSMFIEHFQHFINLFFG